MKAKVFKIEGMNCDACAGTIKTLIEKEPGVQMAAVLHSDRQAVNTIQKPGFRVVGRE